MFKYHTAPSCYLNNKVHVKVKILLLRNKPGTPSFFCFHHTLKWAIKQFFFQNWRADPVVRTYLNIILTQPPFFFTYTRQDSTAWEMELKVPSSPKKTQHPPPPPKANMKMNLVSLYPCRHLTVRYSSLLPIYFFI